MHVNEREASILNIVYERGFVSFKELDRIILASPASIRRDLDRLEKEGRIARVRGGAKLPDGVPPSSTMPATPTALSGAPFHENIARNTKQKEAIGRAAAALCVAGEGVMIDGGSTTLQICPNLAGLNLQVLTNSLHIVSALIGQSGTRVLVPSGAVFPEQNIILSVFGDDGMPRFHAPKLFMGAASIGPQGLMQADVVLVAAERRLIARAEEVIVLVDSSKFNAASGNVVCELNEIDTIITDARISASARQMIESAKIRLIVAE